ncbi:MAG: hypothetical protein BAA02_00735 [Paenibacillaceae bacterium ZCTH02-B3]|nr:MAG: hypothetical protein BAA02_00735 [Paenibacillaceae bacterium ZCTH02-B3]
MGQTSQMLRLMPRQQSDGSASPPSGTMAAARRLNDKASLLRPLKDEHLLEVYREAKRMNLSAEFIELLEDAISLRQLEQRNQA